MSADNLMYAMPFKRMDGQVAWRVFEAFLSSLPWDKVIAMSVQSGRRKFLEFSGEDAEAKATATAERVARQLPICEYGACISGPDEGCKTMRDLQDDAIAAGYSEDVVNSLREASDVELDRMEVEYWATWT